MFDTNFAMLFRAVDRIRCQLVTADDGLRYHLSEELLCLKRLGEQYIDHWMTLEEQIGDLIDTYQLDVESEPTNVNHLPFQASSSQQAFGKPNSNGMGASPRITLQQEGHAEELDDMDGVTSWAWELSERVAVSFRRGLAYYDLFMFDDAAHSLEEVVEASDTPIARLYLAASYAASGRSELALKLLASVRLSSKDELFLCAADEIEAQLHMDAGRYRDALHSLEQIARRIPKYADVWFNLSICHSQLGQFHLAESSAIQALRLEPGDTETAILLGAIRLKMGKTDEAREICTLAMHRQPRHLALMKVMAAIARQEGNDEQAIAVGQEMVRLFPHEEEAWNVLSWHYLRAGRSVDARLALEKQLSLFPNAAHASLQLAILLLLENEYERSERILLNCLAHHPHKSFIWIALGVISAENGEDAQAQTRFLRATKDTRKEIRRLALYQYAKALLRMNRPQEAEKYARAAAALGRPNVAITKLMAAISKSQGRPLEAERLLHRANHDVKCKELE